MSQRRTIGVCAMEGKARSKPMRNILQRLLSLDDTLETVIFGDKLILDEPVDRWPAVDVLVAFHSTGFPLRKVVEYCRSRPARWCVNNVLLQELLLDRRAVLAILDAIHVPSPKRIVVSRDGGFRVPSDVRARVAALGVRLPAVLFPPSSQLELTQPDPDTIQLGSVTMRKPFVEKPVSGEDHNIHIYYAGGGVRRLFRKVANKSSDFVADVWQVRSEGSFLYEEFMDVENSEDVKVYTVGPSTSYAETRKSPVVDGIVRRNADGKEQRFVTALSGEEQDIARRICTTFGQFVCGFDLLRTAGKSYVIDVNGWSFVKGNDNYYDMCAQIMHQHITEALSRPARPSTRDSSAETQWKLKAFISVFRHADRTPKQKLKMFVVGEPFVAILEGSVSEIALKKKEELFRVLEAAEESKRRGEDEAEKMDQLIAVLEKKSPLSSTRVQIKPCFSRVDGMLERLLIIIKWGGDFTHAGQHQSKDLGENLRKDLLILNRRVLDDIKIFTSAESRVMATANNFCQAFLDLDKVPDEIIQITKNMLGDSSSAKDNLEMMKPKLQALLNSPNPQNFGFDVQLPDDMPNPVIFVRELVELMKLIRETMRMRFESVDVDQVQKEWCCSESPALFRERWERLFKDFCDVEQSMFDPSKVSELYDSLKYDSLHNRTFIECMFVDPNNNEVGRQALRDLYRRAHILFNFVAPKEYGISKQEKLDIGLLTSLTLLRQVEKDLELGRASEQPFTRLYFTKESHVHTLFNVIEVCFDLKCDVNELDYLYQFPYYVKM